MEESARDVAQAILLDNPDFVFGLIVAAVSLFIFIQWEPEPRTHTGMVINVVFSSVLGVLTAAVIRGILFAIRDPIGILLLIAALLFIAVGVISSVVRSYRGKR